MEKSESKVLLLENDCLQQSWENDTDDIGFSSGYDSSNENSDVDVDVAASNDDTYLGDLSSSADVTEVMNYRATGALCDQLKYILSMPELCDVIFLVGPNKVPVHGVKAILGTRSRVMYQLILKQQRQSQEESKSSKKSRKSRQMSKVLINVSKYEPEDFRRIIQFMHCGAIDVNARTVTGLLCGASQFELNDLKTACWDFVRRTVTSQSGSVAMILRKAQGYSNHKAGNRLIRKINKFIECSSTDSDKERSVQDRKSTTV